MTPAQEAVAACFPDLSADYVNLAGLIDLGGCHFLSPMTCHAHPEAGTTSYLEIHPMPDKPGQWCIGLLSLTGHGHGHRPDGEPIPEWQQEQADPVTLSPSVLCQVCKTHGFVRAGRWVTS